MTYLAGLDAGVFFASDADLLGRVEPDEDEPDAP